MNDANRISSATTDVAPLPRPVRLHLGCGEQHLDGYVNIDYPASSHNLMKVRPDLEADLRTLSFPRASVAEIRLHHVFEHFPRAAALGLLIRWHEWLELGGQLRIEVPDLEGSARRFGPGVPYWDRVAAARHLIGDQAAPWAFHVELWFRERLERTLQRFGFEVRSNQQSWPSPPHLANLEIIATKVHDLCRAELVVAADELLHASTVSRAERPMWEVWRTQLRRFVDGDVSAAAPFLPGSQPAHAPPAPDVITAIFSRDRPLQLEATLRSFFVHCRDRERTAVTVLYRATTPSMQGLYARLAEDYPSVVFRRERQFREDLLEILAGPEARPPREAAACETPVAGETPAIPARACFICFVVDDTLFVGDFGLGDAVGALLACPEALGFSLRLGSNITSVYAQSGREQPHPEFRALAPGILDFNWKSATLAFAYPIEVSSSIYRLDEVRRLAQKTAFNNPNTLEAHLAALATPDSDLAPRLLCYERSVAFSAPLNVVQRVFKNRVSSRIDLSVKALADAFARGDRIDVMSYADMVPNDCHVEIDLAFRRRAAAPVPGRIPLDALAPRPVLALLDPAHPARRALTRTASQATERVPALARAADQGARLLRKVRRRLRGF